MKFSSGVGKTLLRKSMFDHRRGGQVAATEKVAGTRAATDRRQTC